jgi:predicted transposase/invertase (TIGR01784 family)
MTFVAVTNDVAFHKIFGNAQKSAALISFLNAVLSLEGEQKILSVIIENPYLFPQSHGGKTVVLDIQATDHLGRHFIVEMQVADREGFEKRTQFYAARDYAAQIGKGASYESLRPTYFVGILSFSLTQNPYYYSHHLTIDKATGECLLKDVQYFFIELPKFKKKLHELESMMDKWAFFIKNSENLNVIPTNVNDEGLAMAYEEANRHTWTKAELNAYLDADLRETDHKQGLVKAEKVGREKAQVEAVLGMNENGVPIAIIAKSLKISDEQVNEILQIKR